MQNDTTKWKLQEAVTMWLITRETGVYTCLGCGTGILPSGLFWRYLRLPFFLYHAEPQGLQHLTVWRLYGLKSDGIHPRSRLGKESYMKWWLGQKSQVGKGNCGSDPIMTTKNETFASHNHNSKLHGMCTLVDSHSLLPWRHWRLNRTTT